MLESISWQQFFLTVAVLIGGYYLVAGLLLYGSEITNFLKQKRASASGSDSREQKDNSGERADLMGQVRYAAGDDQNVPREVIVEADMLDVALSKDAEEPITQSVPEGSLTTDASNLIQEVKTLLEVTATASQEECASFFQSLLSRYPQLVGTPHEVEVSDLIYNSFKNSFKASSLQIEPNTIQSWWPRASDSNTNQ